jgi:hypothetical protein
LLTNSLKGKPGSIAFLALAAAALVLMFWAIAYGVGGLPIFETNDDVVQSMLCGGAGFSTLPNEHLPYTHYLIGLCLQKLYTADRQVPWYGLNLVLAQLIAATTIVAFLSNKCNSWKTATLVAAVLFFGVCLRPCLMLQFTTTAALIAAAGSVLLLDSLSENARHKKACTVAGLTLISFGSMIRYESALVVIALTVFAILAKTLIDKSWKQLCYGLGCSTLAVLSVLILWSQHSAYYDRSNGWNEYYKHNPHAFNLMVGQRISCENPKARAAMKKVGWLPVDLDMFRAWAYLDKKIYSIQNVSTVDQSAEAFNPITVPGVLLYFQDHLGNPSLLPTHVTLFLCCFVLCLRPGGWKSLLIYLTAVLALILFFLATKYLPPHMYAAFTATSVLFGIYFNLPLPIEKLRQHRNLLAAAMTAILVVSGICCLHLRSKSDSIESRSRCFLTTLHKLAPTNNKVLVCWGAVFPYELVRPFDALPKYFKDLHLIGMNWMVRTPVNRAAIADFGIGDLFNELDKPGLLMVANKYVLATVRDFTEQHYGKTPVFEKIIDDRVTPLEIYTVKYTPLTHSIAGEKSWKYFEQQQSIGAVAGNLTLPLPKGSWVLLNAVQVGRKDQCQIYKNISAWPTLSYFGPLSLKPSDFSSFFIEAGPSDWIVYGRGAHIQLQINGKEQKSFSIVYGAGNQLKPYSADLDSLNLLPTDRITHINIVLFDGTDPYGKNKVGDKISIGRIGFVRKAAQNQ